ncbi:Sodium-dependent dicarboxylate transporter SdcS [Myxococcaceae bacterium]|jgi:di/tricarboxylate transporter|nr:Sodium-dependent dicarboxylate transporter SdcS [Myxococcaceae bacterium]
MEWQAWFTLAVVGGMLVALAREMAPADLVLLAALFTLAAFGVLTPEETFQGFANEGMATVAALFVVAAALSETGALEATVGRIFGNSPSERGGLARICVPVAASSAFLNNTPIVAMLTPVVIDWARRRRLSASRFLLPMDYATILGGTTTIIGTSTNLVVAGLLIQSGMAPMGFFELAPVGVPVAAAGLLYLVLAAPRLLPDRRDLAEEMGEHRREYTASMRVDPSGPLVGRSVAEAGLRNLPGLFLVEIDRGAHVVTPVGPDEVLRGDDRLVFAGVVSTIVDLQRIRGLVPLPQGDEPVGAPRSQRLVEAVISASSPLVGSSVREASFRGVYDAAVIGVHRNGVRVGGKIGEIVLRPGDTLLLQTGPAFLKAHRNSPDFYLVSELHGSERPRFERAPIALATLFAMILAAAVELVPISIAAFLAAGFLVATRCLSLSRARASIDWTVLIVIAASLGVAEALHKTGAAAAIAGPLANASGGLGLAATLAIVYAVTTLMTETLSNNAAAALMFPIAIATANAVGADPRGFAITVAIAASCGFASPIGYQTHLIVYGPGGYRFWDFVRIGLPLDVLCGIVTVLVVPLVWG